MFVIKQASQFMRRNLSKTHYLFQKAPAVQISGAYGIYVHVPFCPSRCNYCPFYSEPIHGHMDRLDEYSQVVVAEINSARLENDPLWLYIGGGTPNILSINQLSSILHAIRSKVDPGSCGVELLPSMVDEAYLQGLADLGITKISMGVQTLDEPVIRQTGRKYILSDKLVNLVEKAQSLGLWVSLDLMVGLAGQTPDQFHEDIRKIIQVAPDQLAIYPFIRVKGVEYGLTSMISSIDQYQLIESVQSSLEKSGYQRDTAWIFSRDDGELYDTSGSEIGMEYVGFGAGAYSVYGEWKMMNLPLLPYLHCMHEGQRMAFVSPRRKSSEDMRRISKMIYHLRLEKYSGMGLMSSMVLRSFELSGYSQHGILTPKGRLLSHEISKAAMEALPFPIQDPTSIDNLSNYQKYCQGRELEGQS